MKLTQDSKDKQKFQTTQSEINELCSAIQETIYIYMADVCESKVEVTTPFWASNSNGKVRAILNNDQFEQAIHQEICT